jgi:hypothetical protein
MLNDYVDVPLRALLLVRRGSSWSSWSIDAHDLD